MANIDMDGFDFDQITGALKPKVKTAWDNGIGNMEAPVSETSDMLGAGEAMSNEFMQANGMDALAGTKSDGGFDLGDAFSAKNIGGTLQGIGAIAGAAAGIYDAYNRKKYQDKVFKMEEQRVARETARQDKQQAAYEKVFG